MNMNFMASLESYRAKSIKERHKVLEKAPAAIAVAAIGVLVFNITENAQTKKKN
jgi:hypothetical protein